MKLKKNKIKSKIIVICFVAFIIFLITPFIINWIASISNENIVGDPSTIESTWINFFGSYIGGFLSALIGAGISGTVAYYLIGKEVDESTKRQNLSTFSINFNTEFQIIKNDMIRDTLNIHNELQDLFLNMSTKELFIKNYDSIMDQLKEIHSAITSLINRHILILSCVKAKEPSFDCNDIIKKYTILVLAFNETRIKYTENISITIDDIVNYYNAEVINKMNDFRVSLLTYEKQYITVLFPTLSFMADAKLHNVDPITEKTYEDVMKKNIERLQ